MKKIAAFILVVSLLLVCSCGAGIDEEGLALLRDSANAWSNKTDYSASFCLNMTVDGLEYTLLFAQGSYTVTSSDGNAKLDAKMSQVSLGASAEITASWENGVMTSVCSGTEIKTEMTESELFSSITYIRPFVPDDKYVESCESLMTGAGSGYDMKLKDAVDVLFPLVGGDIFQLASIYKPRYDMTKVKDAAIIYTTDGSNITGMKISFVLKVYDTPPYVPGGDEPDPDDYALEIEVSFNVEYK